MYRRTSFARDADPLRRVDRLAMLNHAVALAGQLEAMQAQRASQGARRHGEHGLFSNVLQRRGPPEHDALSEVRAK